MAIEVYDDYDDPILDWDDIAEDLALLEASEVDDRLHIDWETPCHLPALGGGGMRRVLPVYGTVDAWIKHDEAQWRLDVADATCRPAVIR